MNSSARMCSVGDLKNNLRILQSEARTMKYNRDFDLDGLTKGNPNALLPVYNHVFSSYNPQFSAEVLEILDDNLFMKSDVRFMEGVYRVLRDMFHFKPSMTKEQFFTVNNFAERKIIMCVEVMRLVQEHCRFMGPKNPTNPNIKVTSVVDTGRSNKKSATDLVTSKPSAEGAPSRKVSAKDRAKSGTAVMGFSETGWQLKLGYLRPNEKEKGRENWVESSGMDSQHEEGPKPGMVASVVREFSPNSAKSWPAGVAHTPHDKQEKGHMGVMGVVPKAQRQPPNDWDPTGAVECILAKVRDLPAQLTNFMKAVEGRLQKIEERMDGMEGKVSSVEPEDQHDRVSEVKQHLDTLDQRLLLLENRVTLLEAKPPSSALVEGVKAVVVTEEKKDFTPGPFVSLERGDDLFPGSFMGAFSPIRQDLGDLQPSVNESLASIAEGERRLSSTPNQSLSTRPTPQNTINTAETEKMAEVNVNSSTFTCENLDTSTLQQVERIRDMLKATQGLLPSISAQEQADT